MKVLLVDNYDSFTHNLKQILSDLNVDTTVKRNDQINLESLDDYSAIVLSPGPGIPDAAGDLKKLIFKSYAKKPILGICLGMQAIGEVFDSPLRLMEKPMHGLATNVYHYNDPLFKGIPSRFTVGRYHSWVIDEEKIGDKLQVISRDDEGRIMGVKLKDLPVFGLQFHPESIMTEHGKLMVSNFLKAANHAKITE